MTKPRHVGKPAEGPSQNRDTSVKFIKYDAFIKLEGK